MGAIVQAKYKPEELSSLEGLWQHYGTFRKTIHPLKLIDSSFKTGSRIECMKTTAWIYSCPSWKMWAYKDKRIRAGTKGEVTTMELKEGEMHITIQWDNWSEKKYNPLTEDGVDHNTTIKITK